MCTIKKFTVYYLIVRRAGEIIEGDSDTLLSNCTSELNSDLKSSTR